MVDGSLGTFGAVFSAVLLAKFIEWLIKKFVEPWWDKGHDHIQNGVRGLYKGKR